MLYLQSERELLTDASVQAYALIIADVYHFRVELNDWLNAML
jgi:hypothetical protein